MYGLTKKQNEFYKYLKSFKGNEKPTYRKMAEDMGYKSSNSSHRMMMVLFDKGLVEILPGRASGWKLI